MGEGGEGQEDDGGGDSLQPSESNAGNMAGHMHPFNLYAGCHKSLYLKQQVGRCSKLVHLQQRTLACSAYAKCGAPHIPHPIMLLP